MKKSDTILIEIINMLADKQITYKGLTHLTQIEERANGKQFPMSEHIRGLIYSLLSNNRPWEQIEANIKKIDEINIQDIYNTANYVFANEPITSIVASQKTINNIKD